MKKALTLIAVAVLGLSSAAFAAETIAAPAPVKHSTTVQHKKHHKAPVDQKAQAAKKHHQKAAKPAVAPAAKPAA